MHEIKTHLEELEKLIKQGLANVDLEGKKVEVAKFEEAMQQPGFWDDSGKAQEISQKAAGLQKLVETWEGIVGEVEELLGLVGEVHAEEDPESAEEFRGMVAELEGTWRKLEISTFLSGKYDQNNAIVSIHAGTGGTDAADFAEMLLRM